MKINIADAYKIWMDRSVQPTATDPHQGTGGISRGIFVVLQGASKAVEKLRPEMPPITLSGKLTVAGSR
jgi:hypothetical protein